jgi:hypothetical protein
MTHQLSHFWVLLPSCFFSCMPSTKEVIAIAQTGGISALGFLNPCGTNFTSEIYRPNPLFAKSSLW